MDYILRCTKCNASFPSSYRRQICGACGELLEVEYKGPPSTLPKSMDFWKYSDFLPKGRYKRYKVGGTPLINGSDPRLFLKLELDNPTKSFKDRGSVIEVSKAKGYDYSEIVVASTGNMAYSICHYAKIEGIPATVFIGEGASSDKLRDIANTHDADIRTVKGDFTKAQKLAQAHAAKTNAFLAGDYCYRKEGQKTIAYELAAQAPEATHIIVPVGNATLVSGVFKALLDIRRISGRPMPKIVAVQAEACSPLVKAVKLHKKIRYEAPRTRADAIAVGMPTFGYQAIDAIKKTKGAAITVTDEEMKLEQRVFSREYGKTAELAGVASIAAFKKMNFKEGDMAVAIVSGGNV